VPFDRREADGTGPSKAANPIDPGQEIALHLCHMTL